MKTLSKTILAVLATGVLSCGLLCQQAQAITTSDLGSLIANNGSLTIGDKTFSNFTFSAMTGLSGVLASGITVTASFDSGTGIYFLSYAADLSLSNIGTGTLSGDVLLGYRVTASGGNRIDYIDQRYTGGGGPNSFLRVDETINAGAGILGASHLSAPLDTSDFPGSEETIEGDNLFPIGGPQPFLNVSKDIHLSVVGAGDVSLSLVEQSFHQSVPDGGSAVALLGIALAGIEGVRRLVRTRKA
jgi:VPDSG-CTERM motif